MKEFIDFYKLVWKNYQGSRAFFRGELIGIAFTFLLGVLPMIFTFSIWLIFFLFTIGSQLYIMTREYDSDKMSRTEEMFKQGQMALMVRGAISNFSYTGFAGACFLMALLVKHLPQLSQYTNVLT